MSENDAFARSVALEKALNFWGPDSSAKDEDVLKTAEAFRKFLVGESTEKPKGRTPFKLPRLGDGYLYFRFVTSPILYRSDLSYGSMAGGVDRINLGHETEWRRLPVEHAKGTRYALNTRSSLKQISAPQAAELTREHMSLIEFE